MDSNLVKLILSEQKENDTKSFNEIKQELNIVLGNIFEKYLIYENNVENLKEIKEKLNEYQYARFEDLNKGDFIRYINPKYFNDIKLAKGGFISVIDDEEGKVQIIDNNNKIYNLKFENFVFFKKLSKEDIIKLTILEALF
jgi:hypothetical protein